MSIFRGRIGVIGSGALGALYGAKLFRAGHDVHFLMRSDYEEVRRGGLKVLSCDGNFDIRPPVYKSAGEMGQCDLLLIGLKTTSNGALPGLLAPTVGPVTVVLTLQNGLGNEEEIARVMRELGHADAATRIIGGIAFLCSNRPAPGVINHTDHGRVRLAEFTGPAGERLHALRDAFKAAGVPCTAADSLVHIRWEKLVWNIPFNGLGVAAGSADSAAVLADPELARCARELMREVIAAAMADGVTLDPALEQKMIEATPSMHAYKSSMQIDYEMGRPLEVESILGEPVRRARKAGIPVPKMEMLYGIVRRLGGLRQTALTHHPPGSSARP